MLHNCCNSVLHRYSCLPSKQSPRVLIMYGWCLGGLNGCAQWSERFPLMTGAMQLATSLQPLLVTSFYDTILSSVCKSKATTGSSDVGDTISSFWTWDRCQMPAGEWVLQRGLGQTVELFQFQQGWWGLHGYWWHRVSAYLDRESASTFSTLGQSLTVNS